MSEIGLLLKEKREEKGLSLEEIAEILKIRLKYLQFIEENIDAPDMPSPVYMLGYLRVYADFLGLNGQAIINQLRTYHIEPAELSLPNPYMVDNKPSKLILIASIIFIIVLIFSWNRFTNDKGLGSNHLALVVKNIQPTTVYKLSELPPAIFNDLKDYQFNGRKDNLMIVAKEDSSIKVANHKGEVIADGDLIKGHIYLVPYKEGTIITSSNKEAIKILDHSLL